MKIVSKNSKLLIPLLIFVVIVWGMIIRNIVNYYHSENEDDELNYSKGSEKPAETTGLTFSEYPSIVRDPFSWKTQIEQREHSTRESGQKIREPIIVPQLNYKINGIIINQGEKLIVFEDRSDMDVIFLREGDEYKNIIIKEIKIDCIILLENGSLRRINMRDSK